MKAKPAISVSIGAIAIAAIAFVFITSPSGLQPGEPSQKATPAVSAQSAQDDQKPVLADPKLKTELVADELNFPTSMAFVDDKGSMLILEKNTGKIFLVSDGTKKVILKLSVGTGAEQGLLGIAVTGKDPEYVFLYLTETDSNGSVLGNRIYRYEWNAGAQKLENPKLIFELPAAPGPVHNGGKMTIGKDGELFAVIGDINRVGGGPLGNRASGEVDDTSIIVRMDKDGQPLKDNPFASYGRRSMDYYYAYGIRNSFGLDVDPQTGILWETENGPDSFDEINVVHPGFNSGWNKLTGPMSQSNVTQGDLFYLQGGYYADPVFSWKHPVGVTDIKFFTSDKLGEKYKDNIFVGDYNAGQLYFFQLNKQRDGLVLGGHLSDKIADTYEESIEARFALFPGGVVNVDQGPDGYLYVLTFAGKVYRIMPESG